MIRKLQLVASFLVMLLVALMPVTQAAELQGLGNVSGDESSVFVQESELASLKNATGFLILEPLETTSESSLPLVVEAESLEGDVLAQASYYNTCGEAKYMNVGESLSLYIDYKGDIDWFKWSLPTGGKLKVDLNVPYPKDYDLELYTGCTKLECKSDSEIWGDDESCTFTIPSAGWVYAKVYGYGGDYSTTNPYTIKGTLQSASVDLVADALVAEPSTVYENEPFILHARFKNTGSSSVNQYFVNYLYLNGGYWTYCSNDIEIRPDIGYECAYKNLQLSAGTYTLKQVVDAQKHIQESSELNNAKEATLIVVRKQPQYDLYAQPLVVTPANPYDTSQITIQGIVKNNAASISSSFTNRLYVDGALYKPCSVSSLASGSSSLCSYSGRFGVGEHLVRFYADADQVISETNEENNYQEYTFSVQRDSSQDYDLIVTDIWSSTTPRAGESFSLSFSVDNTKPTSINRVFANKLYVDGNAVGGCNANYLLDGSVFPCSVSGITLNEGTHTIKAVADSGDVVPESDEGNNARIESLVVTAPVLPDIVVGSLWTEPDALIESQQFTVKYTLTNLNEGVVSRGFSANLYVDGGHQSSCNIPSGLAKGSNYPCSASVGGLITGSHILRVVADAGDVVAESVENNNEKSRSITVSPKPCPVPDGSRYCDCNYHSDCPVAYPYCQDAYPAPISDGYDACLAKQPLYCGDGVCNNGETWGSCSADCDAPQGRVYVDVKNTQRNPVTGAFVYLDDGFKGTTSGLGKIDFSSGYGNRNVKILCPDQGYCSTKSIAVDGNEYPSFQCGCVESNDPDGDGFTNEDESLAGSNPRDALSTPFTVMEKYAPMIERMTSSSKSDLISEIILPTMQAMSFNADGTVSINEAEYDEESVGMPASAVAGFSIGAVAGAIGGLVDDVKFIVGALWYVVTNIGDYNKISDDVQDFIHGLSKLTDPAVISAIWNGHWKARLEEGEKLNDWFTWDESDRVVFNNVYAGGWTAGYATEQIFLLGKGTKFVFKELKAGKIGKTLTGASKEIKKLKAGLTFISEQKKVSIVVKEATKLTDDVVEISVQSYSGQVVRKTIKGSDIVHLGDTVKPNIGKWKSFIPEHAADAILEAAVKGGKIVGYVPVTGAPKKIIKMSDNFILAVSEEGGSLKIWKREGAVIEGDILKKARVQVGELDRFAVVDNKPVIIEAKSGLYDSVNWRGDQTGFIDEIDVSVLESKKFAPVRELYGSNPEFILIVPKGEGIVKEGVKRIIDKKIGSVVELSETPQQLTELGKKLDESYRLLKGGAE